MAENKSGLEIVPLEISDLDAVFKLDQVCFPKEQAFPRRLFALLLKSPDCLALGIKDKGKLAGFVIAQAVNPQKALLVTLDIAEAYRRRNLGKKLLDVIDIFFSSRGFKSMTLEVDVGNHSAIRLYEKLGYKRVCLKQKYYPDGADAFQMEKQF